jgi:hypothetical protein
MSIIYSDGEINRQCNLHFCSLTSTLCQNTTPQHIYGINQPDLAPSGLFPIIHGKLTDFGTLACFSCFCTYKTIYVNIYVGACLFGSLKNPNDNSTVSLVWQMIKISYNWILISFKSVRSHKLEKADILEMTVKHLRSLQKHKLSCMWMVVGLVAIVALVSIKFTFFLLLAIQACNVNETTSLAGKYKTVAYSQQQDPTTFTSFVRHLQTINQNLHTTTHLNEHILLPMSSSSSSSSVSCESSMNEQAHCHQQHNNNNINNNPITNIDDEYDDDPTMVNRRLSISPVSTTSSVTSNRSTYQSSASPTSTSRFYALFNVWRPWWWAEFMASVEKKTCNFVQWQKPISRVLCCAVLFF